MKRVVLLSFLFFALQPSVKATIIPHESQTLISDRVITLLQHYPLNQSVVRKAFLKQNSEALYIESRKNILLAVIFDGEGKMIHQLPVLSEKFQLDLDLFNQDIHYIHLVSTDRSVCAKLTVHRGMKSIRHTASVGL